MVTAPETHNVAILAPWYVTSAQGVAIHRYLDPGFVAQFQADVSAAPQNNASLFAWQREDQVSSSDTRLKLRRPVHRTFHMVAWEASCIQPTAPLGYPAIAPNKIASAGFVLRDVSGPAPLGFQIANGKPQGWAPVACLKADPDATRELKSLALVPRNAAPSPGYTGEETFPLHPLSVTAGSKPHTLLYGYLPIGGGDYVSQIAAVTSNDDPSELPWPFGLSNYPNGPPALYTADQQIVSGTIQPALAALLRVLLVRYQLVDPTSWTRASGASLGLIGILNAIGFYFDPPSPLSGAALRAWAAANLVPGLTLGSVLNGWANTPANPAASTSALLTNQSSAQALLSLLNEAYPIGSVDLLAAPPSLDIPFSLLVEETVAAQIRAIFSRPVAPVDVSASTMPTPKLISGPSGNYAVTPFVRVVRPDGCEKIFWGTASAPFCVAAMFDPAAARPCLIEMPDLNDAMKGKAIGASFKMPPNLANLANGMSTSKAISAFMSSGALPNPGLSIGYICSFSLPAISICAMLALSIILSLLNIFLGWLAWVKICLPIPEEE